MLQRLQSECSNQYKVNTYHYHYIKSRLCVYLLPAFSLSIIIDSRVKIIGNERPGASLVIHVDVCKRTTQSLVNHEQSDITYDLTFHVRIFLFHWDFFIFYYSQSQVIKLTSCLPMVGGSLRLLPPLKLVVMIQLKY